MTGIQILSVAALLNLAGCTTSLAPGDDFNDWTKPTASLQKEGSAEPKQLGPS